MEILHVAAHCTHSLVSEFFPHSKREINQSKNCAQNGQLLNYVMFIFTRIFVDPQL